MNTVNIKLHDIFHKEMNMPEEKAQELVRMVAYEYFQWCDQHPLEINEAANEWYKKTLSHIATKEDAHRIELNLKQQKAETKKAIYWAAFIQFLAIVGSVIVAIAFLMKK